MQFLILLLAASDLSGLIGEYLRTTPGAPEEQAVIEKLHVYYDVDPAMVESAIRDQLVFPPAENKELFLRAVNGCRSLSDVVNVSCRDDIDAVPVYSISGSGPSTTR